ncbi:MAG: GIY-YIG nuclease family protein [Elioraea sp.]|nr:GIY-YIG nuclease family protein [Elioraea sp.]
MTLRFNMLLAAEGIAPADVRLLRHQKVETRVRTPYSLWRDDPAAFERYQSMQHASARRRAIFAAPYWASFVVTPDGETLFVGLYQVARIGPAEPDAINPLTGEPASSAAHPVAYDRYDCRLARPLSAYIGRLFIRWGDGMRSWVQRADNQDKEIVALAREFQEPDFPGFSRFIRPLSEIETMPPSWKAVLTASRGVYLLACPRTREHYVGSAYGADGFLGRWRAYVANSHGGNVGLRIRDPSDYVVSVLEVAGSATTAEEIIALEGLWKMKLLSRDMGLNRN